MQPETAVSAPEVGMAAPSQAERTVPVAEGGDRADTFAAAQGDASPIVDAASAAVADGDPAATERRIRQALDLVIDTLEALATERGEDEKIWGSMVKQALRRRKPGFSENYYGFRSFNRLLEEARDRGLIELSRDEKSGGYTLRSLA